MSPILTYVSRPTLYLLAPRYATGFNIGILVMGFILFQYFMTSIVTFLTLQVLAVAYAYRDPFFDDGWIAYFERKRPPNKSILKRKGHRYAGR